jgi:hypothetical protein
MFYVLISGVQLSYGITKGDYKHSWPHRVNLWATIATQVWAKMAKNDDTYLPHICLIPVVAIVMKKLIIGNNKTPTVTQVFVAIKWFVPNFWLKRCLTNSLTKVSRNLNFDFFSLFIFLKSYRLLITLQMFAAPKVTKIKPELCCLL